MKKGGKALLTMGIATTMAIGTIGITNITNIQKEEDKTTIQAYNHTPANILDNVFTIDNNKYLPFIFNNTKEVVTKSQVEQEFTKAGLEIESIDKYNQITGDITTGTTIKVKGSSDIYTVIVYGDVDGNGTINVFDALRIVEHIATDNKITGTAFQIAANVENGDNTPTLNVFDALRIVGVIAGEVDKLVVNEPMADPNPDPGDTEKPTISIGKPIVSVEFKGTYNDNDDDVTAEDNAGRDLTAKIVREKIEFIPEGSSHAEIVTAISTERIGTYKIFYKVSDSSGNTETSTRTITVKGLSSIKIGHGNQELNLSTLNLHIEKPVGDDDVEEDLTDYNIYTIVPITFYDQNGTPIELKATDIQINPTTIADGKLGIDLSKVNTTGNEAVLVKYYDENGNEVAKTNTTTDIKMIGFAMSLQGQNKADISQLNGKEITFKCRNKETNLPITVNYKPLQSLTINTETEVNTIGQDKEGNYIARVNEEFTLGIIEVGELEEPITQAMIDQGIISFRDTFTPEQMEVWYEIDSQGRVLVKGNIKVEATYAITLTLNSEDEVSFTVKGVTVAKELTVSIGNQDEYTLELLNSSDEIYEDFIVGSSSGKQLIALKNIEVIQKVQDETLGDQEILDIDFYDADEYEIDPDTDPGAVNKVVDKILMTIKPNTVTNPVDVLVTITLFDDVKGIGCSKSILVHIK